MYFLTNENPYGRSLSLRRDTDMNMAKIACFLALLVGLRLHNTL